jgi:hypothetical protein
MATTQSMRFIDSRNPPVQPHIEHGQGEHPYLRITPVEPSDVSIIIAAGQHLDEQTGLRAAGLMMQWVMQSIRGRFMSVQNRPSYLYIRDAQGVAQVMPSLPFDRVNWLFLPRINSWMWPTRCHGALPGDDRNVGIDTNRCWPNGPLVNPYWKLIQAMPGRKVVLDMHSTYKDRIGDAKSDSHLYVTGASRQWIESFVSCAPVASYDGQDWLIVDEPARPTFTGLPLEEAANDAGMLGITVEITDQGCDGLKACRLLEMILHSGLEKLPKQ